jgi:hypothetical protein
VPAGGWHLGGVPSTSQLCSMGSPMVQASLRQVGMTQKPCTRNGAFGDPTRDAIRRSVTKCRVDGPCQSFASYTTNQRTMTMYRPGGMMALSRLRDRTARYPSTSQSVNHINHIGLSMISITYDGGEHPTQTRSQPTGR